MESTHNTHGLTYAKGLVEIVFLAQNLEVFWEILVSVKSLWREGMSPKLDPIKATNFVTK